MKVCIYAISYNDETNVETWYNSVKFAEKIIVLDRGSSDNTVNLLKEKQIEVVTTPYSDLELFKAKNDLISRISNFKGILLNVDLQEYITDINLEKIRVEDIYNSSSIPGIYKIKIIEPFKEFQEIKAHTSATSVFWKYLYREECTSLEPENFLEDLPITIIRKDSKLLLNPTLVYSRIFADENISDIFGRICFIEFCIQNKQNSKMAYDNIQVLENNSNLSFLDFLYVKYLKALLGNFEDILFLQYLLPLAPWYRDLYIPLINYFIKINQKQTAYSLYINCKSQSVQKNLYIENTVYWQEEYMQKLKSKIFD